MPFEKQILPTCPRCDKPGLRVIESRITSASTRRRKECELCGHRLTTHEITEEAFNAAKLNASAVLKIRTLVRTKEDESFSCLCLGCKFNEDSSCAFELPEYGTKDAEDCNLFEAVA
jgi:hypothetical protein